MSKKFIFLSVPSRCPYNPSYPVSKLHSFREIKPGKFAKYFNGPPIVSQSSIYLIIKAAKMHMIAIARDTGLPFPMLLMPAHTFIFWRTTRPGLLIMCILTIRAKPKITFTIVQSIVVFVVAVQMLRGVHYHSVHENRVPFFRSTSIKDIFCFAGTPFVLRQPFIIFRIYNCEFTLRQKYEFCSVLTCFQSPQNSCTSVSSDPHSGHLTWVAKTFEPSGSVLTLCCFTQRRKVHLQLRHKT